MLYELAFAGYVATVTVDLASGVHARAVGAHEQVLPHSPSAQLFVSGALVGVEWATTRYLWQHHHKAVAIGLLVGSAAGHGWAARHNFRLRSGERVDGP